MNTQDDFEALHFSGVEAQMRGDYTSAEGYFRKALAAKPDYAFAQLALSQVRMMQTEFAEGRDLYEARFAAITEGSAADWRGLPMSRWQGESLAGKKLYLWAEQGLGDIIMFAGFLLHLLALKPARVALGMYPKLISLFARSFPQVEVESIDEVSHHALGPTVLTAFPQIEQLAQYATVPFSLEPLREAYDYATKHGLCDVAAPMADLMVHFMPQFKPVEQGPYLIADATRVQSIREELAQLGKGKLVGISWHTDNTREPNRNVPLAEWIPLLAMKDCHFVSLQHRVPAEQIEQFCRTHDCKITVLPSVDLVQDAEGLVALIAAMDEVVTIDNSNAHIAGALGVKTTLLLPKGCNYRWPVLAGGGTLWYKSARVLRQKVLAQWQDVMGQISL